MHQLSYRKNPQPGRKACFMGSLFQDSTTTTPTTWSHNSCLNRPVFRVTGKKLYQSDIIHMTFIFHFRKLIRLKLYHSYLITFILSFTVHPFRKCFFDSHRWWPTSFPSHQGPNPLCFVAHDSCASW